MTELEAYFEIKDKCRKGLLEYFERAITSIPQIKNPQILDIGCGTGVPSIYLASRMQGQIMAVDTDSKSIAYLHEKVKRLKLSGFVHPSQGSLSELDSDVQFDLIIAEGLLNIIGFEAGFLELLTHLNRAGHVIIHDDHKDYLKKKLFIENKDCTVLHSFVLDEKIWWRDYYQGLEREIALLENQAIINLFESDLSEIRSFKKDSTQFKSRYYIIQRN